MTEFESLMAVLHSAQQLRRKREMYEKCQGITGEVDMAKLKFIRAEWALDTALDRHEREFGK